MRKFARILALTYAAIVGLLVLWAWYANLALLHKVQELPTLPELLLFAASLPTSPTYWFLYDRWPSLFSGPFVDVLFLTAFGAFQAALLYLLSVLIPKARGEA
jgi:hypothetical protein